MKRPLTETASEGLDMPKCLLAPIYLAALVMPFASVAQQFRPASHVSSWYTDRSPIDVEIAATKGQGRAAHPIDPPQVLRLRLERAYLQLLIRKGQPQSSNVSISFDLPTGLPSALFQAPPEQVETQGDPIHRLATADWASRTVNISLASTDLTDGLDLASSELRHCKGAKTPGQPLSPGQRPRPILS